MPRGRPIKADRPVKKGIHLPESLVTRVDLMLFSELEGKVPHAAWAGYVQTLIESDLARRAKEQKQ